MELSVTISVKKNPLVNAQNTFIIPKKIFSFFHLIVVIFPLY